MNISSAQSHISQIRFLMETHMGDTWMLWVDWVSGDAQTCLSFKMSVESLSPGSTQCVFLVIHGALRGLCSRALPLILLLP